MKTNLTIYLLILSILVIINNAQQEKGIVKLSVDEDDIKKNIGLDKFDNCLVLSQCDDHDSCKAQIQYCRVIYCSENKKTFQQNEYKLQNSHANCIEFCIHKLFLSSQENEAQLYLECLFSRNDKNSFFVNNGYKSRFNYFGTYKPKIQLGSEAQGVSQYIEEFFVKRNFEIVYDIDQNNINNNSNQLDNNILQNISLKWNIQDEIVETDDHCSFVKFTKNNQKLHHRILYQINHPIQFIQLLTRKDCLKKILSELDSLLTQSCLEQDQEDRDKEETHKNKCILLFSSKDFLLKSYYIDTKKEIHLKLDDSQNIIDGKVKQNIKYVLKPTSGNYGSGLKFVRNFEEFRQKFIQMTQKNQKLIYKEYILEEFLENQLLIGDKKNFDLTFFVSVLSTSPQLVYARKGYIRENGYEFDVEAVGNPFNNNIFNSRYFEVLKSGEMKALDIENNYYSFEEFFEMLIQSNISTEQTNEKLLQKCLAIVTYTIQAYINEMEKLGDNPNIVNKFAEFSLLRFDFIIDNQLNPYLIEVEGNPLSGEYLQFERNELTSFLEDSIDYVHQLNLSTITLKDTETTTLNRKKYISKHQFEEKNSSYIMLINDATEFHYITDVFEV